MDDHAPMLAHPSRSIYCRVRYVYATKYMCNVVILDTMNKHDHMHAHLIAYLRPCAEQAPLGG